MSFPLLETKYNNSLGFLGDEGIAPVSRPISDYVLAGTPTTQPSIAFELEQLEQLEQLESTIVNLFNDESQTWPNVTVDTQFIDVFPETQSISKEDIKNIMISQSENRDLFIDRLPRDESHRNYIPVLMLSHLLKSLNVDVTPNRFENVEDVVLEFWQGWETHQNDEDARNCRDDLESGNFDIRQIYRKYRNYISYT